MADIYDLIITPPLCMIDLTIYAEEGSRFGIAERIRKEMYQSRSTEDDGMNGQFWHRSFHRSAIANNCSFAFCERPTAPHAIPFILSSPSSLPLSPLLAISFAVSRTCA